VYWEARVSIHGRQVSFYAPSKTEAQAQARQARADAERGVATPRQAITVEAWLRHWLAHVEPSLRARTHNRYRELSELHIIPAIGGIGLRLLTPAHVERLLSGLMASGLSLNTATQVRATLSVALHQAQRDHGLPRNVASLAKMPKTDRPAFKPEVVTPDQARAILAAFEGHRLEPLVMFSIATGVRQGESLALRWQDVDEPNRAVTIRHAVDMQKGRRVLAKPKSARSQRRLRLSDMALAALELARAQEAEDQALAGRDWQDLDLVFPGKNGAIRAGPAVTKVFQTQLVRKELRPLRWHALRRVFAALLQDDGVPLERIRDLMGHSTLSVTESYAYTLPASLDRDMGAIDRVLGSN